MRTFIVTNFIKQKSNVMKKKISTLAVLLVLSLCASCAADPDTAPTLEPQEKVIDDVKSDGDGTGDGEGDEGEEDEGSGVRTTP